MKFTKTSITAATIGLALTLAACSDDAENADTAAETTKNAESSTKAESAPVDLPTAEELNGVLQRASDPNLPAEERTKTVEGGEDFPELFDTLAAAKVESGANFEVQSVFPGYTDDTALTIVGYTMPDREPQTADNVEFIHQDGQWKLSREWACVLVTNTVEPEQVPEMCLHDGVDVPPNEAEVIEEGHPGHPEGHDEHAEQPAEQPAQERAFRTSTWASFRGSFWRLTQLLRRLGHLITRLVRHGNLPYGVGKYILRQARRRHEEGRPTPSTRCAGGLFVAYSFVACWLREF